MKLCTKLVVNGSLSKASNTLGYIAFKYNTNKQEVLNCFKHYSMVYSMESKGYIVMKAV